MSRFVNEQLVNWQIGLSTNLLIANYFVLLRPIIKKNLLWIPHKKCSEITTKSQLCLPLTIWQQPNVMANGVL